MSKPSNAHTFGIPAEPVYCEKCEKEIEPNRDYDLCDECHDFYYCECGQKLEDSAGQPGDGFCRKCG